MFGKGDKVKFKTANRAIYEKLGKKGRTFTVTASLVKNGKTYYALLDSVTGSTTKWMGESLLINVEG